MRRPTDDQRCIVQMQYRDHRWLVCLDFYICQIDITALWKQSRRVFTGYPPQIRAHSFTFWYYCIIKYVLDQLLTGFPLV